MPKVVDQTARDGVARVSSDLRVVAKGIDDHLVDCISERKRACKAAERNEKDHATMKTLLFSMLLTLLAGLLGGIAAIMAATP